MQINNVTEKEEGTYKCYRKSIDNSTIHESLTFAALILQVPPTIRIIKNVTNKILRCEPDGIPQNYRYHRWQHLSEYGQLIRLLPNKQTILMDQNSAISSTNNFKLSGMYVCSAENGVADIHGSTIQTGKVSVLLQDKPRFVAVTENIQYGLVGTQIDISVRIYCYPELISSNILTSEFCCYNKTEYQLVSDYNITVSSFGQTVRMKGYKISLEGFTLTDKDFTTYIFWIQNEIGEATFSVKLMLRVGGIVICSIVSNTYCYLKRNTRVNVMLETYPAEHYDEIGTINYNNVVFETPTDVPQENDRIHRVDSGSDLLLRIDTESSEESVMQRLADFSQCGDGYEHPYHSINPESIEMHPYCSIGSNMYKNTIIFPTTVGTKKTLDSTIAMKTSKTPWLIIHTKMQ
ncbi:CD56 [Mytilus edulis]|uniref:NCAM n=1 Tax=Mytilus edulis TaxID=6550 RepID=A0A8S3UVB0_MYTED|nr:CD56 [Mytilus edulis]